MEKKSASPFYTLTVLGLVSEETGPGTYPHYTQEVKLMYYRQFYVSLAHVVSFRCCKCTLRNIEHAPLLVQLVYCSESCMDSLDGLIPPCNITSLSMLL